MGADPPARRPRAPPRLPVPACSGAADPCPRLGPGPMATSTLLARGGQARTTIGSVNAAAFVVTIAISATFFASLGLQHLELVLGHRQPADRPAGRSPKAPTQAADRPR